MTNPYKTKIVEKSCVKTASTEALFNVKNLEGKFWTVVGLCLLTAVVATTVRYVIWLFVK